MSEVTLKLKTATDQVWHNLRPVGLGRKHLTGGMSLASVFGFLIGSRAKTSFIGPATLLVLAAFAIEICESRQTIQK